MVRSLAGALALLAAAAGHVRGQDGKPTLREWLRPRATLRASLWTSSRTVDGRGPLAGSVVWAEIGPPLAGPLDVRAAGWLGAGASVGASDPDAALRELYLRFRRGAVDVRVGKQIIAWGRADALNPTDNVSPDDLTLLVPDDDDQKTGVPAVNASLELGGGGTTLRALWLADFRGHTLPLGAPPTGVRLVRRTRTDVAAQGAIRIERAGGRVDWSASYFTGYDLTPDIAVQAAPGKTVLELGHHRLHVLGADAALVLGRYGLRAEAAWIRTEDGSGADPEIKNSTLYAVVGGDRTLGGYFNVNVQYLMRWVDGYVAPFAVSDPARREAALLLARVSQQLRRVQHGATLRVSNKWWHETLEAEVAGVLLSPPWQLAIRPRVSYAVTDRWQVEVGADLLDGNAETLYHVLRKNSLAFLEVRLGL